MGMTILTLLLAVTLTPRPGCTFTVDVADIAGLDTPKEAAQACESPLMRAVTITGSRADLTIVLDYTKDMQGVPIADTFRAPIALRGAMGAWSVWRSAFKIQKFTLKYRDLNDRDLCWFTFTEEAGVEPTVNRCVVVGE